MGAVEMLMGGVGLLWSDYICFFLNVCGEKDETKETIIGKYSIWSKLKKKKTLHISVLQINILFLNMKCI